MCSVSRATKGLNYAIIKVSLNAALSRRNQWDTADAQIVFKNYPRTLRSRSEKKKVKKKWEKNGEKWILSVFLPSLL